MMQKLPSPALDKDAAPRIPYTSSHPDRYYITSVDRDSAPITPTEVAQLSAFLAYQLNRYGGSYLHRIGQQPYDTDSSNTCVFVKWDADDWGYRRHSWHGGPTYVPWHARYRAAYPSEVPEGAPFTLVKLMDRILGDSPGWRAWKASRLDTFRPLVGER